MGYFLHTLKSMKINWTSVEIVPSPLLNLCKQITFGARREIRFNDKWKWDREWGIGPTFWRESADRVCAVRKSAGRGRGARSGRPRRPGSRALPRPPQASLAQLAAAACGRTSDLTGTLLVESPRPRSTLLAVIFIKKSNRSLPAMQVQNAPVQTLSTQPPAPPCRERVAGTLLWETFRAHLIHVQKCSICQFKKWMVKDLKKGKSR